jgi:hypothetical protein
MDLAAGGWRLYLFKFGMYAEIEYLVNIFDPAPSELGRVHTKDSKNLVCFGNGNYRSAISPD